ncbi:AAA family ATPase [Dehalobacter sp. TBBPA1]|uniref:AAA family ATPase n=1 Tax=Dehalobacter sp. TBBPA1 TaxID=3235037 RepID=UPI0034A4E7FB
MRYKKFCIRNYKAIEDLAINLNRNVIPLIGVNESGKTSILQAILAFDKDKDNILGGGHANPKNKYKTTQASCQLIASIEIENEDEFRSIGEEIRLRMDNPLYDWLKSAFVDKREISIMRNYGDGALQRNYSLVNESDDIISNPKASSLITALVKRLPNILYFDDFSDRVPEVVSFPENYVNDGALSRGKDREWQEIIVEIFSRALQEEFSLTKFLKLTDDDDQDNYLSDVTNTLNREIIEEWQKLKTAFSQFSDDSDKLELSIKYIPSNKPTFKFKVIDSENSGNDRMFDVSQRSKGFQWFFNFIMKLKFNPKYKLNPENAIYLLDEPGSYLHSSAQTELLKKLCNIAENNTIIYCTHSQYLLDPDIINIGGIKIVSKADSHISLVDYGNSSLTRSLGAFSALNDALHLKFGFHENILKQCVLVEGIVDYYFYKMFFNFNNINIIPGAGCGHLRELISIMISCSEKFLVVLDYDNEGRASYNSYSHFFKESFTNRAYQYEGVRNNTDFMLENILSTDDIEKIKFAMNCEDIKNAIVALYFKDEETKSNVVNGIDKDTSRNINIIQRKIDEFFK